MPRTWNAVRPRQRSLTAVLPHQANTRILIPKRRLLSDQPFLNQLVNDTFTDTNGVDLTAHTMDFGPGWQLNGTQPGLEVQSNGAVATGLNADGEPPIDYANEVIGGIPANFLMRAALGGDATALGSLPQPFWYRYTDNNNLWQAGLQRSSGNFIIRKHEAGVDTEWTAAAPPTAGSDPTKFYVLIADGADMALFYDGAVVVQTSDTFNETATRGGVSQRGTEDNYFADNFSLFERA